MFSSLFARNVSQHMFHIFPGISQQWYQLECQGPQGELSGTSVCCPWELIYSQYDTQSWNGEYIWSLGKAMKMIETQQRLGSAWSFHLFDLTHILTHLTYIANGKNVCSVLQQFTGRNAWCCLVPFYDVILPIDHVSLT